jgi:hypothetical protein
VFDPATFGLGDEVRVRLDGNDPGDIAGTTSGTGVRNLPVSPYTDHFSEYRRSALESLDRLAVPASVADLVRDYFTRLEP